MIQPGIFRKKREPHWHANYESKTMTTLKGSLGEMRYSAELRVHYLMAEHNFSLKASFFKHKRKVFFADGFMKRTVNFRNKLTSMFFISPIYMDHIACFASEAKLSL